MSRLVLRPGHDLRLRGGHPWVYRADVLRLDGRWQTAEAVTVTDAAGHPVGRGFYNPRPQIVCRLLTVHDEPLDRAFLTRRLAEAAPLGPGLGRAGDAERVAFGEGDRLPGVILDRYGDVLVLQPSTLAAHLLAPDLAEAALAVTGARSVYQRIDPTSAALEGFEETPGWLRGPGPDEVEITEGPCRFQVAVASGQKTGFYLDQRDNRETVTTRAAGREVLDAFTYTGAFACHALRAGATSVLALDSSGEAVERARRHLLAHGGGARSQAREANVFDALRALHAEGRRFDLVVLDPPPFTRRRTALPAARRGYKEINLQALRLLRRGGLLATFSCSHHVGPALFEEICREAVADARRPVRVLATLGQAPDHPVLLAVPETRYLTGLWLEALD